MPDSAAPVLWLFGLPCSGKTTLARALRERLRADGKQAVVFDGDEMRAGPNHDLGFSDEDRAENLRRTAQLAQIVSAQGVMVIAAFVTPKEKHRALVREILGDHLMLVHVDCPLDVCLLRDGKGVYAKARNEGMPDALDPFELPFSTDLRVPTENHSVSQCVERILSMERERFEKTEKKTARARSAPFSVTAADLRRIPPRSGAASMPTPALAEADATETAAHHEEENATPQPDAVEISAEPEGDADEAISRRKRHRGKFIESRTFLSSPLQIATATIVVGAVCAWLWWRAADQMEKRSIMQRMLAGDSAAAPRSKDPVKALQDVLPPALVVKVPSPQAKEVLSQGMNLLNMQKMSAPSAGAAGSPPVETTPPPVEVKPERKSDSFTPPDAAAVIQRAQTDMAQYFKAQTWREKLPFVRQPDRAGPLMEAFYEKQNGKDVEPGALATSIFQHEGADEILAMTYAPAGVSSMAVELFLVKQPDRTWKLDWESSIGAGEMGWEQFSHLRSTQPVLLRARAQPGNYFNYEFEDFGKYICLRLDEPRRRGRYLFAYCEKGSALAQSVELLFKAHDVPAVTVRVAFPEGAQSDKCVRLTELVADHWLLPE